ncbi:MAG: T9SS type A sorting domain-containing protein [Bacteroidia bacterium]|nr:T9SS type A sorting domain-containing protein [Bacteroidia bacterium]
MKRISILLLSLFLLFGGINEILASHIVGISLTYQYLNSCTLRIHQRTYRDCTGATGINPNVVFVPNSSGCAVPTPITNWSAQVTAEVTPICPSALTYCGNPNAIINGVEEFYWYRDYDMCSAGSCMFNLVWTECCRNASITSGAANSTIYVNSITINNINAVQNNSPEYNNIPFLMGCTGSDYTVSQGAYDQDGDSLSYSLGPCYQGAGNPVGYAGGFSASSPLGPSWNVSIDPLDGTLNLVANPGNVVVGVLCIYVNEWRNGVLINTYVRDVQVSMMNCGSNDNPTMSGLTNLVNANLVNPWTVEVCGNSSFCFDIPVTDPNLTDTVSLIWDQNIAGATFADASNSSIQNVVTGQNPTARFCWTPTASGTYQFMVHAQDNVCPLYGQEDRIITIIVGGSGGGSGLSSASASITSCNTGTFSASVCGGTGPFTYTWSGQGGISSTSSSFTHNFSGPGSYAWQVIISNGGSLQDTIIDTLVIPGINNSVLISPGGGNGILALCPGQSITLNAAPGFTSYTWSNFSTQNTLVVNAPGVYALTAVDGNGCSYYDYVTVNAQTAPASASLISAPLTTQLKTCLGNPQILLAAMGSFLNPLWSTGDTTTHIYVNTPGTYSILVENAQGCQFVDTVVITNDTFPDVYGQIKTYNGYPLANQVVHLVGYYANSGYLWNLDTTTTDSQGNYSFCVLQNSTNYFIKATPDSATYPMNMPTYYDTTLFWNNAVALPGSGAPYQVNFSCILGSNPGGPGFIGGFVTQGANKTAGVGDPMPGIHLFLRSATTGYFVDDAYTDSTGHIHFGNLNYGTYQVYPDHPFISTKTDSVPTITLDAAHPGYSELKFLLNSRWLELDMSSAVNPIEEQGALSVFPNPFSGEFYLSLPEANSLKVILKIYGLNGEVLESHVISSAGKGKVEGRFGRDLVPGIYFAEIINGPDRTVKKLIKLSR